MADPVAFLRFQPCLLDRLCDDEPDKQVESGAQRVISFPRYKIGVLRDITWLLNSSAHVPDEDDEADLSKYPLASRSVLNLGIRSLTGLSSSSLDTEELERRLLDAVERFEPRINRRTLRVKFVTEGDQSSPNVVAFEISGELYVDPVPQHLIFKTKIDLYSGQCVGDRPNGP